MNLSNALDENAQTCAQPNLYDGSLLSMAIIMVITLVCRRIGVNPFQVLWMLNMANRRGHGGVHRRMGGFGYGAYPGGGGFGFGRRRGFGRGRW